MRLSLYLFSLTVLLAFVSCTKGYSHEKIVTNNSKNAITVYAGCCDNIQEFVIQPGQSETVFACMYQQIRKPETGDLSWEVKLVKEGQTIPLNQPEKWLDKSSDRTLRYEYIVVGD